MKTKKNRTPLRTALVYAIFGALWIVISDKTLEFFVPPASPAYLLMQTIKGWLFVLTSAVLIYFIAKTDMKSLLESEKRYRAVAQTANDSIISADGEGNIVGWNHGAERIFGYTESEVLGRPLTLLLPTRCHERHLAGMARMRAGGEKRVIGNTIELEGLRKDGSEFPLDLSLSDWQVDDQEFYTSIIRDITERRQMDDALKASEEKYRDLVENSQNLICTHDLEGNLLSVNEAAVELSGYSRETLLRMNLKDALAPNGEKQFAAYLNEIKTRGQAVGMMKVRIANGEFRTWAYNNTLRVEGVASPIVRGSARDITERKQAEEALQASEERYRVLSELISDYAYSFRFEPDGRTVYEWVTAGFTKIPGYTLEEIIERGGTISLVHPEDIVIARQHIRALLNNQTDTSEFRIVSKDGTIHWLRNYAQPIWDEATQRVCRIYGSTQEITERKLAEEATRESERQMKALVSSLDDIVFEFDEQGTYLNIWTANESLLVQPKSQLLGRKIVEVSGEEIGRPFVEALQRVLTSGSPESIEYPLEVLGGQRWFTAHFSPILTQNDGRRTASMLVRDITERKQEQEEYQTVIKTSIEGFWIIDTQARFLVVNDAYCHLIGYEREELMTMSVQDVEAVESPQETAEHLQKVLAGGYGRFETKHRRKDGRIVDVEIRVSFQPYKGGRFYVFLRDITENKQVERVLHQYASELELRVKERTAEVRDLYEHAPAGYHSLNSKGIFIRINQTELDWFGYTHEEVLGVKAFDDLITDKSKKVFAETFPIFKTQGWIKDLEFEMIRKDGSILIVLINATAIYDKHGEFVMSRSSLIDITKRKQAELKLQTANILLEKASKLKDEFLANMSHELRTPLNGILGYSDILLEGVHGAISEKQQLAVQMIRSSGEHLLGLINDILDVSRIEAGKLELQPEIIEVDVICQSSLVFIKQLANKKSIAVEYSSFPANSTILADPMRLKQILVNLLNNAVKFTPEKGTIKLEVQANDGAGLMRFSITDTGIGISSGNIQKLFKPFVQLDSSLSRQHEGAGLGLVLTKNLVEMHGGSIEVQSEAGAGSCFTFVLPWTRQTKTKVLYDQSVIEKKEQSAASKVFGKILIVDDNETNVTMTQDYLELRGYQVLAAYDGDEVLQIVEEFLPDIILMDIQMPGMNGFEAARRLRADPRFASVPIIALTALAMPGDRERCLEAGMNEYLSKPVKLKELTEMIEKFLAHSPNK